MNQDLKLKLQALLDGELPAAEAERLRRLAAADPEAGQLLAEWQSLKAALIQNEPATVVPETREFYWSKIQKQIEHTGRQRPSAPLPWFARWRLLLPTLTGAAALAAVLMVALRQNPAQTALDQVSVTTDGFVARTFRDQSSGISYVFLEDTRKPQPASASPPPARARDDGSSFMVEFE